MSQSGPDRKPARLDVRAAAAAAIVFGVLGGGNAGTQQGGKPSADVPPPEAPAAAPAADAAPAPTPAQEPAPAPSPAPTPEAAPAATAPAGAVAGTGSGPLRPDEVEALRADAAERLKALAPPEDGSAPKAGADPAAKLADKALSELLEARRRGLDEYAKLAREQAELADPEKAPDRRIEDAKAELADLQARLARPVDELLPELFTRTGPIDRDGKEQMKEAIEALKKDVKADQDHLESIPRDPEKQAREPKAALRAERDRASQDLAALKTREEARAEAPAARSAAERRLFDERGVNLRVESALATLRLQLAERKIERTDRLAELAGVDRRRWIARAELGRKLLEPMQARYRRLAEAEERDLQRLADAEQAKAGRSSDPIERHRSRRLAELLDLEAAAIKAEQAATASLQPSLEDMRRQANISEGNFARIKGLIEGDAGLSRIEVLGINAEYRRLEPERRRIRREEREAVDRRLRDYANMLTSVELSQIEDRLRDQIDLDDLLDKLPSGRHPEAVALWKELESRHSEILARHRDALEKLVRNESEILDQIDRRLQTLDDESSFIRTHMFWVRDQEPIGATTAVLAAGEVRRATRATIGLAREAARPSGWKAPTPEFLAASAVVLVLPLGAVRVRRALGRRLAEAFPADAPPPPSA